MSLSVRLPVVAALIAALAPPAADAWPVGRIGWGDTDPNNGWTHRNLDMDCAQPTAATLVASFEAPAGVDSLYAVAFHIDFCAQPFALPEWWQFDQTGGCREDALSVNADFSGGPSTHVDYWRGMGTVNWTFIPPPPGGVQGTIQVSVTLDDPAQAYPLVQGTEYYLGKMEFAAPSAVPCAGCEYPACFMINDSVTLHHAGGITEVKSDYWDSQARWQGGQWNCSFIVSVVPDSWGRVKSLYE